MKKYIFTLFIALALVFVSVETRSKDRIIPIDEIMLKNIEYLSTPENPDVRCFGRGSVDCPKHKDQVLYYS